LTILAKAVEIIQQTTGKTIDPLKFPLDDKPTFELLQRGETKGVFQLESGGIRDLLQKMKPDHFRDIIATNALYRPGPLEGGMVEDYVAVKHGRKVPDYKHQVLRDILEETNGVMVYQEQVMRILNRLGGIELAKAYTCIKAISKKKESIIAANEEKFIQGSTSLGLPKDEAIELWNMILKFAGYGFNKSHSTAYALIAYQTAYLKAHFPCEFMAALLSGDIEGRNFKRKDSLVEHLEDCTRMGITVLPPDVNHSHNDFAVKEGKIRFALSAIRGCGGGSADAIVAARLKDGPFKDIFDFCERVDPTQCNRSTIETLIRSGAMDGFGARRSQLLAVIDKALQAGAAKLADRRTGQRGLFDDDDEPESVSNANAKADLPDMPEMPEKELLQGEKDVLGFYLSAHPLSEHESASAQPHQPHDAHDAADCPEPRRGDCGWDDFFDQACPHAQPEAWELRRSTPTSTMEDLDGTVRCICWPDGYEQMGQFIEADAVVLIRGAVDRRDGGEECNLICNEVTPLHAADSKFTTGIRIHLDEQKHTLRNTCCPHPGDFARVSRDHVRFCSCLRSGHWRIGALTLAVSIKWKWTGNCGIG
jgi:DNA polymerase-3 subunit alpha